jgi:hypothetical protein
VLGLPGVEELEDVRSLLGLDGSSGASGNVVGVDLLALDVDGVLLSLVGSQPENLDVDQGPFDPETGRGKGVAGPSARRKSRRVCFAGACDSGPMEPSDQERSGPSQGRPESSGGCDESQMTGATRATLPGRP